MRKLENILAKLRDYRAKILTPVFEEPEIKSRVLELSRAKLYVKGELFSGAKLRTDRAIQQNNQAYSTRTIRLKRRKGRSFDRVTLKDRGNFYNSFKYRATPGAIFFSANFNKGRSEIYDNFENQFDEHEFYRQILFPQPKMLLMIKSLIYGRIKAKILQ